MQFQTEEEVRDFLRLCLGPGRGIERTPAKLVEVMPEVLRDRLEFYAPELAELRAEAERLESMAAVARRAHVAAVSRWITPPVTAEDRAASTAPVSG
jgi:hypothetical protein